MKNIKKMIASIVYVVVTVALLFVLPCLLICTQSCHFDAESRELKRGYIVSDMHTCEDLLYDLFEGLVCVDRDGHIVSAGAVSWETDAECQRWRFRLRSFAQWSDSSPVRADHFVQGLMQRVQHAHHCPAMFRQIQEIAERLPILNLSEALTGEMPIDSLGLYAAGDDIVEFELTQGRCEEIVLPCLTSWIFFPLSTKNGLCSDVNGPFKPRKGDASGLVQKTLECRRALESCPNWDPLLSQPVCFQPICSLSGVWCPSCDLMMPRQGMGTCFALLQKNSHFHDHASVFLKSIQVFFYQSEKECSEAWEKGEIDLAPTTFFPHFDSKQIVLTGRRRFWEFIFNPVASGLSSKELRQSLSGFINRDRLHHALKHPWAEPRYCFVTPATVFDFQLPYYLRCSDEQKHKALQKELVRQGYTQNSPFILEILYVTPLLGLENFLKAETESIKELQWICTQCVDSQELNKRMHSDHFQIALVPRDPEKMLLDGYHRFSIGREIPKKEGEYTFFKSQEYDDLIKAHSSLVYQFRTIKALELKGLDQCIVIPLFCEPFLYRATPSWSGFPTCAVDLQGRILSR